MAKQIGNKFFVRFDASPDPLFLVCEQQSTFSLSSEDITVICKTSGEFAEILAGGTKSGSLSFTGAYEKDPTAGNLSAFGMIPLVGTLQDVVWGGLDSGDDVLEFPAKVSSVEIVSNTNEAITYSVTLNISGAVTVTKIPT